LLPRKVRGSGIESGTHSIRSIFTLGVLQNTALWPLFRNVSK
jgi:hypothetical protein